VEYVQKPNTDIYIDRLYNSPYLDCPILVSQLKFIFLKVFFFRGKNDRDVFLIRNNFYAV